MVSNVKVSKKLTSSPAVVVT